MSYNVYNGEYPGVPNHGAILIETNPGVTRLAEAGRMYHVTGNLLMGMKFDPRNCIDPEGSVSFVPGTKRETSAIAKDDLAKFERERCDAPLCPGTPLYRCGDWHDVQELAFEKGIIRP
ncbi:hypothetical protein BJX61DRAFT_534949 [Aspergillus egyptiacus]|nr:hypothetical protein BJX61DRAFT_534949 [Aspergillus egyptiacus]